MRMYAHGLWIELLHYRRNTMSKAEIIDLALHGLINNDINNIIIH